MDIRPYVGKKVFAVWQDGNVLYEVEGTLKEAQMNGERECDSLVFGDARLEISGDNGNIGAKYEDLSRLTMDSAGLVSIMEEV